MTENVLLTDEAWLESAPELADGICTLPIIQDHLNGGRC